jgi:hypothetical protein
MNDTWISSLHHAEGSNITESEIHNTKKLGEETSTLHKSNFKLPTIQEKESIYMQTT